LQAVDSLNTLFSPFLPFSSEKLNTFLGYEHSLAGEQFIDMIADDLGEHRALRYSKAGSDGIWKPRKLPAGQKLNRPSPIFKKLEPEIADQERGRLGTS
jgi:methionyl-tRNA synthetase